MTEVCRRVELTDLIKQILELNTGTVVCVACGGRRVQRRIVYGTPLALLQARHSASKVVTLSEACPHCDGSGQEWDLDLRVATIARELGAPRRMLVYA